VAEHDHSVLRLPPYHLAVFRDVCALVKDCTAGRSGDINVNDMITAEERYPSIHGEVVRTVQAF
jgi:hypothetical protein